VRAISRVIKRIYGTCRWLWIDKARDGTMRERLSGQEEKSSPAFAFLSPPAPAFETRFVG
jgi:hypothetical protein